MGKKRETLVLNEQWFILKVPAPPVDQCTSTLEKLVKAAKSPLVHPRMLYVVLRFRAGTMDKLKAISGWLGVGTRTMLWIFAGSAWREMMT
ncbi:hypothetical protein N7471_003642 [Penicillium samsonianum]|uniref:uncharacterized protein n=1 Tax=Penicillium samsonianum TaxID=1882272 RepID=UPI0025473272|nr:uncharacterized protein N7471_003642 [Penicillium samsonianum]KAJ6137156.1 hypothetical protein N7471_003642 [Penicillium samsonianum]